MQYKVKSRGAGARHCRAPTGVTHVNDNCYLSYSKSEKMGKVTTTITITNQIDQTLAERGFIPTEQIRSITLHDVLVDTGATRLCLPKNIILNLGLPLQGEVDVKIATGVQKARVLKC
ncbi:MAG: hypothetical protein V7K50_11515 [Nostoc sp.]|uniref:hypothetical protein n=1 Tax=Nostoc sp. TaxID=1180 RepID=UPI002FF68FBB